MNIVLIWMQDMEIHVHLILGAILASILATVIFLIAELDNPFRGEVSIGPDSIERVYEGVMKPHQSGTAEDALAMLAKAVAAVQEDKTKALPCSTREKVDSWTETSIHFASMSATAWRLPTLINLKSLAPMSRTRGTPLARRMAWNSAMQCKNRRVK